MWETLNLPFTVIRDLKVVKEDLFFFAASPTQPLSLVKMHLHTKQCEILKPSFSNPLSHDDVSVPTIVEFPSEKGKGYGFFYPPKSSSFTPLENEKPPLIVKVHGGPTACSQTGLNLETQFWTSRGFAVVEVNYSGSSGFGRQFREKLNGNWGILDVADSISCAKELAKKGLIDEKRMIIKGGSAGGYTALCAVAFHQVFAAAVSYYGVADPEALAKDTHKFESRYLDSLIGPYPQEKILYLQRSPLHHAKNIQAPLLLLQGKEDPIVPLNQAEAMHQALLKNNIPASLIVFENESHGFKHASTIRKCAEAELSFYSKLFSTR